MQAAGVLADGELLEDAGAVLGAAVGRGERRAAEGLHVDVLERALPYWHEVIVPDLAAGKTVLVAAHGNSIRAIVKYLDGIGDDEIVGVNIPTGIPLYYELNEDFTPVIPGGRYLDPEAAAASIAAVASQGKK